LRHLRQLFAKRQNKNACEAPLTFATAIFPPFAHLL
jgi:hypothetical protein